MSRDGKRLRKCLASSGAGFKLAGWDNYILALFAGPCTTTKGLGVVHSEKSYAQRTGQAEWTYTRGPEEINKILKSSTSKNRNRKRTTKARRESCLHSRIKG